MLTELKDHLTTYARLDANTIHDSGYFWVNGTLTVQVITRSRTEKDLTTGKSKKVVIAKQPYLAIDASGFGLALIPTDDYFMSGISALRELHDTIVGSVDIKVRALVRLIGAQTSFKQLIAIPLVIYGQ